jgi:hypothetical protein
MWYFWIDNHQYGGSRLGHDPRARIHIYMGMTLGGGATLLKTVCGRTFRAKERNIVSDRAARIMRGRICKKCFPVLQAALVAEKMRG